MSANAKHSKQSARWFTPPAWVAMARDALGGRIELDPMSEPAANAIVGAERIHTEQDDGIKQPWVCDTAIVNPPGGIVVEAWNRLCAMYGGSLTKRAIWIGFSVEQLTILASELRHPLDYSLLICRQRMDFYTDHPMRDVAKRWGAEVSLVCGHQFRASNAKQRTAKQVRCFECHGAPEPAGSPSHGNYVVGMGIAVDDFERAFAGMGKFSHGRFSVTRAAKEAA